jgi:CRISPR-associated protein Cmr2
MTYTAISFAPIQGFIEKSRKLRDLYGASLILSYLSQKIVEELHQRSNVEVISPALIKVSEGMPNKILVKGSFIERDHVQNILLKHWQHLLLVCREWVEDKIPATYYWAQTPEQIGIEKGAWERWGSHTWELFWGYGDSPQAAMESLENNKLKRDWTGINWVGESSSLSGIDAIAWPRLGERRNLRIDLTPEEKLQLKEEQELFYRRLSWLLDNPEQRLKQPHLDLAALRKYEESNDGGRYIAVNERLSVPELVKRLITYDKIDQDRPPDEKLGLPQLKNKPSDPEFKDIYRDAGYWTGWFMGDGDKVGDKLKVLATRNPEHPDLRDSDLQRFTELMRNWGGDFKKRQDLFPDNKGRVIYAGGDDFLGVLYSNSDLYKVNYSNELIV